ncbi:hypothetical protein [Methylocystis echinoides]|uniref:hypothetical protein n=1 Tax=Methylocystis echinoides TaxID=29468 RepID=UPI00342D37CE
MAKGITNAAAENEPPIRILPGAIICDHVKDDPHSGLTLLGARVGVMLVPRSPGAEYKFRVVLPIMHKTAGDYVIRMIAAAGKKQLFSGALKVKADGKNGVGYVNTPPFKLRLEAPSVLTISFGVEGFPLRPAIVLALINEEKEKTMSEIPPLGTPTNQAVESKIVKAKPRRTKISSTPQK